MDIGARLRAFLQDQISAGRDALVAVPDEESTAGSADATISLPTVEQDAMLSPTAPTGVREADPSLAGRASRASSIISTRTRFSTYTLQDDARSIDINLAGQHFRISRDGSKVTSDGPPPPYPGLREPFGTDPVQFQAPENSSRLPLLPQATLHPQAAPTLTRRRHTVDLRANIVHNANADTASRRHAPIPPRQLSSRDEVDDQAMPSRNPSYTRGADAISVAPLEKQRRTVSQNDVPDLTGPTSTVSPLRRRNGIRLPSIVTDYSSLTSKHHSSPLSADASSTRIIRHHHHHRHHHHPHRHSHSAGPTFPGEESDSREPPSPAYIGRGATGLFPQPSISNPGVPPKPPPKDEPMLEDLPPPAAAAATSGRANVNQNNSPPMFTTNFDSENDISLHYTRTIRFIDRDHRRALHAKDKEITHLRERLNEVDLVYRQQLKAQDLVIDDLKKRLAHLEDTQEAMLEKARNQVEDLWEVRWKEQERHLLEKLRPLEGQKR